MATSNWTQQPPLAPPGAGSWVEKYRAAVLEINPQRRAGRIAEAFQAMNSLSVSAAMADEDKHALLDAQEVLRSLEVHSRARAAASPWLL